MLPIRNISYLLPMCCSFWEKCKNSPKTGLGCSTPLRRITEELITSTNYVILSSTYVHLPLSWAYTRLYKFQCTRLNLSIYKLKITEPALIVVVSKSRIHDYSHSLADDTYLAHIAFHGVVLLSVHKLQSRLTLRLKVKLWDIIIPNGTRFRTRQFYSGRIELCIELMVTRKYVVKWCQCGTTMILDVYTETGYTSFLGCI